MSSGSLLSHHPSPCHPVEAQWRDLRFLSFTLCPKKSASFRAQSLNRVNGGSALRGNYAGHQGAES